MLEKSQRSYFLILVSSHKLTEKKIIENVTKVFTFENEFDIIRV